MKLFLASLGITNKLAPYFSTLLKTNRHSRSIPKGFIVENASDNKGKKGQLELRKFYRILKKYGLSYQFLDLKKYYNKAEQLRKKLNSADFIYISGGNTFYLYYWVVKSGLDKIIKDEIENGLVFASSSAGSVITGPTIKYLDLVDDISISPEPKRTRWIGLGIVDFVILPHWGDEKYQAKFDEIKKHLEKDGFTVRTLTNKQALMIKDSEINLIDED